MEMENKKQKNFVFQLNEPVKVKFMYNEPQTGVSEYGEWYRYGATINEQSQSFFADKLLHQQLASLNVKKGDEVIITKIAKEGEQGKLVKDWQVELVKKPTQELTEQSTQEKQEKTDTSAVPAYVWEEKDRRKDGQISFIASAGIISQMISTGILKTPQEIRNEYISLASVVYSCIRDEEFFLGLSNSTLLEKFKKSTSDNKTSVSNVSEKSSPKISKILAQNGDNIKTIYALLEKLKKYDFDGEVYQNLLQETYGVTSSLDLSPQQKQEMIKILSEKLNKYIQDENKYISAKNDNSVKTIHILLGKLKKYNFGDEDYRKLLQENYKVISSLDLDIQQRQEVVKILSEKLNTIGLQERE